MTVRYKGYGIDRNTKAINKINPISGHEWSEDIPLRGFHVSGGTLADRDYNTISKAKDAIDFDVKFNQVFGE